MADKDVACPVDHKTRDAWLAQARASQPSTPQPTAASCPVDHSQSSRPQPRSWTQTITSYVPWVSTGSSYSSPQPTAEPAQGSLGRDRTVSSIPRDFNTSSTDGCPVPHGASANAETITDPAHGSSSSQSAATAAAATEAKATQGSDANWVYPSEKMFFDAMRRKGYDAREEDMRTVVPIHNAVNERAWQEIKEWEAPYLQRSQCGGPRLTSFANKAERMTPTARINTILGYTAPFDRHDWVIDRCGKRVEYVIDFYAGRAPSQGQQNKGGPSFYLDVRPKLNTWEGVKMRMAKWTGMA